MESDPNQLSFMHVQTIKVGLYSVQVPLKHYDRERMLPFQLGTRGINHSSYAEKGFQSVEGNPILAFVNKFNLSHFQKCNKCLILHNLIAAVNIFLGEGEPLKEHLPIQYFPDKLKHYSTSIDFS